MFTIPNAKIFAQAQAAKKKAQTQVADDQAKWMARLNQASDEFVSTMSAIFCRQISAVLASNSTSGRVEVKLDKLGQYQGLPGDVLLYGHRESGSWYQRTPLELDVTPFERLQADFYRDDWLLVEESDPSRSFSFVFALYLPHEQRKPSASLWHFHNVFDEKKIVRLANSGLKATPAAAPSNDGKSNARPQTKGEVEESSNLSQVKEEDIVATLERPSLALCQGGDIVFERDVHS